MTLTLNSNIELLASKLIRQSVHDGIELYKERIEEGEEKND